MEKRFGRILCRRWEAKIAILRAYYVVDRLSCPMKLVLKSWPKTSPNGNLEPNDSARSAGIGCVHWLDICMFVEYFGQQEDCEQRSSLQYAWWYLFPGGH